MTYREALTAGTEVLQLAGIEEAALDGWYLLEYVCHITRSEFYLKENETLSEEDQLHYENAVKKRASRVPLQYILGTQEFMGLTFAVNSNVLIPRQDTETLVELALTEIPREVGEDNQADFSVLDLCTGSGCIAVSIKKNRPEVRMTASDASKQALLVAKENAKANETEMVFVRSDLFDNLNEAFDMIISNPPYIRTAEIPTLQAEVAEFEPVTALDGHEDGLYFYRRIASEAPSYLKEGGRLLMEIGNDQGESVKGLLEKEGFTDIRIKQDLAGLDRVVIACAPKKEGEAWNV